MKVSCSENQLANGRTVYSVTFSEMTAGNMTALFNALREYAKRGAEVAYDILSVAEKDNIIRKIFGNRG